MGWRGMRELEALCQNNESPDRTEPRDSYSSKLPHYRFSSTGIPHPRISTSAQLPSPAVGKRRNAEKHRMDYAAMPKLPGR